IGNGGLRLGGYESLQKAATWFASGNSFTSGSYAARDAWTSSDVLNPAKVPGNACPGVTPIECELKITRPSLALIMIGTNDLTSGDVAGFRANLDRIVRICEQYNVVPVLSTIPNRKDKPENLNRVNAYNAVIVSVAEGHGAPLWNYWLAMSALPSDGISTDNLHPSLPPDYNTAIFDEFHLKYGF